MTSTNTLTRGQRDVLEVLADYGPLPDVALVPLAQHVAETPQSSSSIRSRRAELARKGLVAQHSSITMRRSGRTVRVWEATTSAAEAVR